MREKIRKGGWQAKIRYFKNYVIKTPLTKKEIIEKISPHYIRTGEPNKISPKMNKLRDDWVNSIKIVKASKAPLEVFAYPEFLKDGRIKQRRVKMLSEEFHEILSKDNITKAKKLVDRVIDFIIELWQYGIHEITFKFYTEMGLMNDRIVLVDIGELTDDKELVKQQIKKKGRKLEDLRRFYDDKVLDYYQEQIRKRLTVKTLNDNWKKRLMD